MKTMKTKIIPLTMMALAVTALVGCGNPSQENAPASTNSASDQSTPGAAASNNVVTQPGVPNMTNTNNPAGTNQ
jgi:hypothetical protein